MLRKWHNKNTYFSFESENERIFFYLSDDVSAAPFPKMGAELSAAHNFRDERERSVPFSVLTKSRNSECVKGFVSFTKKVPFVYK